MMRPILKVLVAIFMAFLLSMFIAANVSAGGSKIAFERDSLYGRDIWVMNGDGTNQKQLTDNSAFDWEPAWSPDGSKIAFTSNYDGDGYFAIYVINADGTNQKKLTDNSADDISPTWSPDGSQIVFQSNRDGDWEIYVMNADDGSDQRNWTNNSAQDTDPAWSPDGSKIAFESNRTGNFEIYLMSASSPCIPGLCSPQRLTTDSADDMDPAWSPDGSYIAFENNRTGDWEIYVVNTLIIPSIPKRLTTDSAADFAPAWSPDGSKIAFTSNRDGNSEIYVMNAGDGSDPTNLTHPAGGLYPTWSPPPIRCVIPFHHTSLSRGSFLHFNVAFQNRTYEGQVFKFATKATIPNGNTVPSSGWLIGPATVALDPWASKLSSLKQFIPYNAPVGAYTYHVYVGTVSPPLLYNKCKFNFTVTP